MLRIPVGVLVAHSLAHSDALAATGYDNTIPDLTFAAPFAEICWVGGQQLIDPHPAGGGTAGGNCDLGDLGFVVEGTERPAQMWYRAVDACLTDGLRLLEPFEWILACEVAQANGVPTFGDTFEWASNTPHVNTVSLLGTNACLGQSSANVAGTTATFHCGR